MPYKFLLRILRFYDNLLRSLEKLFLSSNDPYIAVPCCTISEARGLSFFVLTIYIQLRNCSPRKIAFKDFICSILNLKLSDYVIYNK